MELNEIDGEELNLSEEYKDKVGQNEIYDLLVSRELSWQAIIYYPPEDRSHWGISAEFGGYF